ncbi:hypothetical protein GCM10027427_07610 [Pseudoclavibacter terrae]
MLEHLMRMHHIELAVSEVERVDVAEEEPGPRVPAIGCRGTSDAEGLVDDLDASDLSRAPDSIRKIEGDGAGPAADIEHAHPSFELGKQVGGGVLGGAARVRAEHAGVVAVGVPRDSGVFHVGTVTQQITPTVRAWATQQISAPA